MQKPHILPSFGSWYIHVFTIIQLQWHKNYYKPSYSPKTPLKKSRFVWNRSPGPCIGERSISMNRSISTKNESPPSASTPCKFAVALPYWLVLFIISHILLNTSTELTRRTPTIAPRSPAPAPCLRLPS